jgi:hypothetical protein
MKLDEALKVSLDELRMQMLGAQVLLGFQFQGLFQDNFSAVTACGRLVDAAGLGLMLAATVAQAREWRTWVFPSRYEAVRLKSSSRAAQRSLGYWRGPRPVGFTGERQCGTGAPDGASRSRAVIPERDLRHGHAELGLDVSQCRLRSSCVPTFTQRRML